jgi:hypothetical protein
VGVLQTPEEMTRDEIDASLRLLFTLSSSTFEKKKIRLARERERERETCVVLKNRERTKVFGVSEF